MQKLKNTFIACLFLCTMMLTSTALTSTIYASDITVIIDDTAIDFDKYGSEPYIVKGYTMIPFRSIFEAFGGDIDTSNYSKNKTITYTDYNAPDGRANTLIINEAKNTIDYNVYKQDVNARFSGRVSTNIDNKDGRIYIQLRAISEFFGYYVDWDKSTKTVTVDTTDYDDVVATNYDDIKINYSNAQIETMIEIRDSLNEARVASGLPKFATFEPFNMLATKIAIDLKNKDSINVGVNTEEIEFLLWDYDLPNHYEYIVAGGIDSGEKLVEAIMESEFSEFVYDDSFNHLGIGVAGSGNDTYYCIIFIE